jgi:hypothetical protein
MIQRAKLFPQDTASFRRVERLCSSAEPFRDTKIVRNAERSISTVTVAGIISTGRLVAIRTPREFSQALRGQDLNWTPRRTNSSLTSS